MDRQNYLHKFLNHSETTKRSNPHSQAMWHKKYPKVSKAFIEISEFKKALKILRNILTVKQKSALTEFHQLLRDRP